MQGKRRTPASAGYSTPWTDTFPPINEDNCFATEGPTIDPMLPISEVPRAKMNVNGWHCLFSVTSFSVLLPPLPVVVSMGVWLSPWGN